MLIELAKDSQDDFSLQDDLDKEFDKFDTT